MSDLMGADGRSPRRVLLLTVEDCHFCQQGKQTLNRLAEEFALEVEEVALESGRGQGLVTQFGVLFPPAIFVEGAFVGFGRVSERKLRKLLKEPSPADAAETAG